jgi:hypothetical protein
MSETTQMDKEIEEYLDAYKVDFPNEEEIEMSIECIMAQVAPAESRAEVLKRNTKVMLSNGFTELMNFGWLFWTLNSLFLLLGIISLFRMENDPYLTSFILAPLPFIVGLFEILKSNEKGLVELEMTFRYNAQQILTSRLLVVGVYNLVINILLSTVTIMLDPTVIFVKLLLTWTVPYVFVTGIAFLIAMKIRGTATSGILTAFWFALCFGVLQIPEAKEIMLKMNVVPASGILLAGVLLWTMHFIKLKREEFRGGYYET